MKHITVIGSGITGLSSAWLLEQSGQYQVTLLEADERFGGHAHAVEVHLDGQTALVDTGFLVFNHKTYPNLTQFFRVLDVQTPDSDMSFGVSIQLHNRLLEWAGDNLRTVFAQKRNLLDRRFWQMLADILRFGRHADEYLQESLEHQLTLGQLLKRHQFSNSFQYYYLLPMGAAIWSTAIEDIRQFPAASFIRFCQNHVLLDIKGRPQWKTVAGSSRQYVNAITQQLKDARLHHRVTRIHREVHGCTLLIDTPQGMIEHHTDQVIFACHTDQALHILGNQATPEETEILGAIEYAPNHAVLHTDRTQMPDNKQVWSSWNYLYRTKNTTNPVTVTYWLNRLQSLPFKTPLMVTLNPATPIDPAKQIATFIYHHPQMNQAALIAQNQLHRIQGQQHCYFAGAWASYGFHEDGLKAALRVLHLLGVSPPWPAVLH